MIAKLYRGILSVILIAAFMCSFGSQAYACTIFNKTQGDTVLVGNNEDWMYSIPSKVWFAAADENTYGRVCFANSTYVQGGMNEKGLFYDGASCPASKVPFKKENKKVGMDLGEIVLSKCASVPEALEMVKGFNIPNNFGDHIMFVDKSGNSAVVEWVEDDLRIIQKQGDSQIATNFWLSNTALGGFPCARFDKAKQMLEEKKDISVPYFADILKATTQDWGDGGTKYSNVYDLKNKDVYVYYKHNFDQSVKYNLDEELKKLKKGEKKTFNIAELSFQSSQTAAEPAPSKPSEEVKKEDTTKEEVRKEAATAAVEQAKSDLKEKQDVNADGINSVVMVIALFMGIVIPVVLFLRRNRD